MNERLHKFEFDLCLDIKKKKKKEGIFVETKTRVPIQTPG